MSDEMRSILNFLGALFGVGGELARGATARASRLAVRILTVFGLLAIVLILMLTVGIVFRLQWLVSVATVLIGLGTAIFLMLCAPIGVLTLKLMSMSDSIKNWARVVGGALLWALLLSVYFAVVPIRNRPGAVFLVILITFIVALLWAMLGIGPNPRKIYASVISVFLMTTVSFFFPKSFNATQGLRASLDESLSRIISNPSDAFRGPTPPPRRVPLSELKNLEIFVPATGQSRYWFVRKPGGGFEVYDRGGFDPQSGETLVEVTQETAPELRSWVAREFAREAEASNRAAAENGSKRRQQEEQERQAFVGRYVDSSLASRGSRDQVAIMIVREGQGGAPEVRTAVERAVARPGLRMVPFLRPAFVTDGLFEKVFEGDSGPLERLGMGQFCNSLLLGRITSTTSQQAELQGLMTVNLELTVRVVSATSGQPEREARVAARGAGFTMELAEQQAEQRLAGAIGEKLPGFLN